MEANVQGLQIKEIYFETSSDKVTMKSLSKEQDSFVESEMHLNFSDLNKLINEVQILSAGTIDLSTYFENIRLDSDKELYVLNSRNTDFENLWIENIDFLAGNLKIRA